MPTVLTKRVSVLVERVHELVPKERWSKRYDHINHFEETLAREGLAPHLRGIRHCLAQLDDNRRQDSASDRQQVRRKYQIRIRAPCLQRGLHLRAVAVDVPAGTPRDGRELPGAPHVQPLRARLSS